MNTHKQDERVFVKNIWCYAQNRSFPLILLHSFINNNVVIATITACKWVYLDIRREFFYTEHWKAAFVLKNSELKSENTECLVWEMKVTWNLDAHKKQQYSFFSFNTRIFLCYSINIHMKKHQNVNILCVCVSASIFTFKYATFKRTDGSYQTCL